MRLNKKILSFSIAVSILLIACGSEIGKKKDYSLSGTITGMTSQELYLIDLLNPNGGPIDTAIVDESGFFGFDYKPEIKGFYRVTLSQTFALVIPLGDDENVTITGDINQVDQLEIEGSADAIRMRKLNTILKKNFDAGQQMEQEFQQYMNSPKKDSILAAFRARFAKLEQEKVDQLKMMIDEDPGLFANLALAEQMPPSEAEYYQKVDKALIDRYGNSPFFKNFHAKVLEVSRFAIGSDVPEINLPDPSGNLVPLSSLRGKVVLIDFWASWCKPCRRENPNVVAAHEKYKDKGFTVYGVSLDRTRDAWVNAIAQDKLNWTQVSDLKFWQSEAAKAYGVKSIPFALLIDKDGKVIGKNLRGPALHQKLEEVLN